MNKKLGMIFFFAVFFINCSSSKHNDPIQTQRVTNKPKSEVKQEHDMDKLTKVLIETSMGNITIALYDETPQHKANFIKLVNDRFYDEVLFHRIIKEFMIQTGDPESKKATAGQPLGNGGPGYTVPAEFVSTLFHKRGAVAAARLGDQVNPQKASSGSQFYIVDGKKWTTGELNSIASQMGKQMTQEQITAYTTIGGAPHLDGGYTVFGEVIAGMDIVDKIASASKDQRDRPKTDIKIISAKVIE